jgi:hypothetical protein
VREIVIVITDLYLEPERARRVPGAAASQLAPPRGSPAADASADAAPGLEHLARFARREPLPEGWRAWIARWAGLPQYAGAAPASIASAPLAGALSRRAVWLATPLHLIAGPTSVHVDRRSMLRLMRTEAEELAASFRESFRGSGFELHPLESGELLLSGPEGSAPSGTLEPARLLLGSVAEALAAAERAPELRRLSAEIEMWLHEHPVNSGRERQGAPSITTLWPWGGGAQAIAPSSTSSHELLDVALGADAYVHGLWRLAGGETRAMPVDWRRLIGESSARRVLGVVEVAALLPSEASWCLADALTEIDRRLLLPSLEALRHGELERLTLLANDRRLVVRAADRWRLWRRKRTALEGLA